MVRAASHEDRLPGEGVGAPTWEVFKNRLDEHLSGIAQAEWVLPLGRRVQGPTLTSMILRFSGAGAEPANASRYQFHAK